MKILIISDSHGHIANLKHIVGFAEKYGVSAIIHAGDWDTSTSVEVVRLSGIPFYTVSGNADIDPELMEDLRKKAKGFNENFLIVNLGGRNIGITHKPGDNKKYFGDKKLDLIINGHYHSKYESVETPIKMMRPGATVTGINFAVYDTVKNKVEFVNENEQF
jgi:hypothetical protein